MNRLQWLQVWGFHPATVPDRRKQASPARYPGDGRAFTTFMRRLSDRTPIPVQTEDTA
jgi:hypothetical protein